MTERTRQIVERYEQWVADPRGQSIAEVADELGTSTGRIYKALQKHDVPTKTQRSRQERLRARRDPWTAKADDLLEAMADNALEFLLAKLRAAEAKVDAYEKRFGKLDEDD